MRPTKSRRSLRIESMLVSAVTSLGFAGFVLISML